METNNVKRAVELLHLARHHTTNEANAHFYVGQALALLEPQKQSKQRRIAAELDVLAANTLADGVWSNGLRNIAKILREAE